MERESPLGTESNQSPVDTVARIAREVAAPSADAVDRDARFPSESIEALKKARMMSALVARDQGGLGSGMTELAAMCESLAQHCASSAMVFAMHQIQVASILRHALAQPYYRDYVAELVEKQPVIASATSEVGIGGEMRTSLCAVQRSDDGRFKIDKDCSTISYGAQADDILFQARRGPDSPPNDQIFVLVRKKDCTLTQKGVWDTLGMRGTCSPPFLLNSAGEQAQIFATPFAEVASETQVPFSHILWANVWLGIAMAAVNRARAFVRQQARAKPGTVPPTALRLAEVSSLLQTMRTNVHDVASECDSLMKDEKAGTAALSSIAFALKMNNLKVSSSQLVVQIVHQALLICGIMGYKNDSKFAVGRHLRDAHSAALMVANDRIYATNASMLLVLKDD
jgi:acyl-CoA dehydrogenase